MVIWNFRTNFRYPFCLEVSLNVTLEEIKLMIRKDYGFPISKQTLSLNGYIIATDADIRLLAASLTHGSEILVDIDDADFPDPPLPVPPNPQSPVSDQASSTAQTDHREKRARLNLTADSDAPNKFSITLKLPAPLGAVNYEATVDETIFELRQWILQTQKLPFNIILLIKDESGKLLADDAMTLLHCQIADKSELAVEFHLRARHVYPETGSGSSENSETGSNEIPDDENTPAPAEELPMGVILQYRNERKPVEVYAEVKVRLLRTILEFEYASPTPLFLDLPHPYFFIHINKQAAIDENLTFLSQNIAQGDIIEIFPGSFAVDLTLKLRTTIPHLKPFFDVQTHSNDTIQELKEKRRNPRPQNQNQEEWDRATRSEDAHGLFDHVGLRSYSRDSAAGLEEVSEPKMVLEKKVASIQQIHSNFFHKIDVVQGDVIQINVHLHQDCVHRFFSISIFDFVEEV